MPGGGCLEEEEEEGRAEQRKVGCGAVLPVVTLPVRRRWVLVAAGRRAVTRSGIPGGSRVCVGLPSCLYTPGRSLITSASMIVIKQGRAGSGSAKSALECARCGSALPAPPCHGGGALLAKM